MPFRAGSRVGGVVVGAALLMAACGPPAPAYGPPPQTPEAPSESEVNTETTPESPAPEEAKPETRSEDEDGAVGIQSVTGMYAPPPGP